MNSPAVRFGLRELWRATKEKDKKTRSKEASTGKVLTRKEVKWRSRNRQRRDKVVVSESEAIENNESVNVMIEVNGNIFSPRPTRKGSGLAYDVE